jgi:hypothetical protein
VDPSGQRRKSMKTVLLIAVLGLTLAATAGDAWAPVAGVMNLGTSVEVTQAIAVGRRASKLIGAPVYNEQEEKVGNIDGLIITPDRSWRGHVKKGCPTLEPERDGAV